MNFKNFKKLKIVIYLLSLFLVVRYYYYYYEEYCEGANMIEFNHQ